MEGTRVIPSSIQPGTLWVCTRDHWHHGVLPPHWVNRGSTALLTEVRQEDGTVEFVRCGQKCNMDWDSFSGLYTPINLAGDKK